MADILTKSPHFIAVTSSTADLGQIDVWINSAPDEYTRVDTTYGPQLMSNSEFDNAFPDGWNYGSWSGISNPQAIQGLAYLEVDAGANYPTDNPIIEQEITTEIGQEYYLEGTCNISSSDAMQFLATEGAPNYTFIDSTTVSTSGNQDFNLTFTATSTSTIIQMLVQGTQGEVGIVDRISLRTKDEESVVVPGTPSTYTLFGEFINDSIEFDISPLIDDFWTGSFSGDYNTQPLDVYYRKTITSGSIITSGSVITGSAYEGYGYYTEGINPSLYNKGILTSTDTIYKIPGSYVNIPIKSGSLAGNVTGTLKTTNKVIDNYSTLALNDTTLTHTHHAGTVKVKELETNCIESIRVTFINKHGAYEDIWFTGESKESLGTTQESFKSAIRSGLSYTIGDHQKDLLRKQGTTMVTLNSGFYPEEYNEAFQQLFLSSKVWMDYNGTVIPVMVKSNTFEKKKTRRDKLINYEVQFEFAFDTINSIR